MTGIILGTGGKEMNNSPWPQKVHNLAKEKNITVQFEEPV